jgi:hypothetical protein
MEWRPIELTQGDLDWQAFQQRIWDDMMNAFRLPPSLINNHDVVVEGSIIVLEEQPKLLPEG